MNNRIVERLEELLFGGIMKKSHNSFPVTAEHIADAMRHFDDVYDQEFEMDSEQAQSAHMDDGFEERLYEDTLYDVQNEMDYLIGTIEVIENGKTVLKVRSPH